MRNEDEWNERYRTGDLPWETGRHDSNLERVIAQFSITPRPVLEIGCGTGNNAIWLARQGFAVAAFDLSPVALEQARDKVAKQRVILELAAGDVDANPFAERRFALVFDRGCFHSVDAGTERERFVEVVAAQLEPAGLWLSLIGSADWPDRDYGPPQLSAREVVAAIEPRFEILLLQSSYFDNDQEDPPRCWVCLARRREDSLSC